MPALGVFLGFIISSAIAKLILALGLGWATYAGIDAAVSALLDQIGPAINSLPVAVLNLLALAGVPQALNIICSAIMVRAALQAVQVYARVLP